MLINLFIKDFGIIDKTEIDFSPGLNILSGETGSGKSIIIDAIQIVSGGRALSEYIRSGCERSIIQATFNIEGLPEIGALLSERGIDCDGGEMLVLSREINRNGRSICRINGQMSTLNVYKELGHALIDIQGQFDQQLLYMPERQMFLLDAYGGEDLLAVSSEVRLLHRECREKRKMIEKLCESRREWARRQDTINYQIDEINKVSILKGEDEELEAERKKLANIEKISSMVGEGYRDLYGGGQSLSVAEIAGRALKNLDKAVELDADLTSARDLIAGGLYQIEEACRDLAVYLDGLEFYPSRLDYIEDRLDQIKRVKKKYGETIDEVFRYRDAIAAELEDMQSTDRKMDILAGELENISARLDELAAVLSEKRTLAAKALELEITSELNELEMAGAQFAIEFTLLEETGEIGREKAEFYISANPGEPVKPLAKVASGGEASRILLAVKGILSADEIPTLIFDEVDTGIGGQTVKSVATKLQRLSEKKQVLCVTHSAIVASMADRHLHIKKSETGGRTKADVFILSPDKTIFELARMLGGDYGGAAFNHAAQLLAEAKTNKLKQNR